jgi:hypothetical protein
MKCYDDHSRLKHGNKRIKTFVSHATSKHVSHSAVENDDVKRTNQDLRSDKEEHVKTKSRLKDEVSPNLLARKPEDGLLPILQNWSQSGGIQLTVSRSKLLGC